MDEVSPFEPTVLGAVRRHWRLVAGVMVTIVVPVGLFAVTRPASYSAAASLTVSDPRGEGVLNGQSPSAPNRYVADQLAVFGSATFANRAVERGLQQRPPLQETPSWFLKHTSAGAAAQESNLMSISFSAATAPEAMAGLRAAVSAYGDVVRSGVARQAKAIADQLDSSIRALDERLAALRRTSTSDPSVAGEIQQIAASRGTLAARRDQVAAEAALPSTGIGQLLLPSAATTAGKSAALRLLVLAIAFGFILGVALAYVRSYRKRVFAHERDPELVLGAPLLIDASVLSNVELLGLASEEDAPRVEGIARELFAIGTSLVIDQRPSHDRRGLSLAVVSAHGGANCSAVAWRSAFAFASQGLRVVLIDVHGSRPPARAWMTRIADDLVWEERADGHLSLSHPRATRTSGQLLAGETTEEPTAFTKPAQRALYYCGEPPPVHSQTALTGAFRALEDDFDVVLINAPFFLPSADAAYLAAAAGTVLVVVPDGGSVPDHVEVARRLELTSAKAIGYVYCSPETDAPSPQQPPPNDASERPKLSARIRARAS